MAQFISEYNGSLGSSSDLKGIYRARVENNMDPLKIGRVQIRVPMIHGFPSSGISSKNLPWAYPSMLSAGYGYGTFIVPEVGEYVFVIFEDSDSEKPVYIGSSFGSGSTKPKTYGSEDGQGTWQSTKGVNEVPVDARRSEPTRKIVYKSPKGASIEIDEINGAEQISVTDALGQMLKMESNLIDGVEHKRYTGDMDDFEKRDSSVTSGTRVVLMDSQKQKVEMTSDGKSSTMTIGNDDFSIVITSSNGKSVAKIQNSGGAGIQVDGSTVKVLGNGIDIEASSIRLVGDVTIVGS
jgi:hypothetical protein